MHGQEHSSKKEEYHEKHSQPWNAPLRIRIVGGNEELEYSFVEQDSQNASNETSAHSICHGFRKDHAPQLFLIHSECPLVPYCRICELTLIERQFMILRAETSRITPRKVRTQKIKA